MDRNTLTRRLGRGLAVVAAGALAAGTLAFAPASSAAPQARTTSGDGWCASPSAVPCIVSVTRDGTAIADNDPTWSVSVSGLLTMGSSAQAAQWSITSPSATVTDPTSSQHYASLPASETSHTWSITVRVGFVPRETDGYGDGLTIDRHPLRGGDADVTVTGTPVTMGVNDECTVSSWPWSCPSTSGANTTTFQGDISNFEQWSDRSQWADFNGMDMWTNVEESDVPPQVVGDPFTVKVDLANSHVLAGDSEPFEGSYHVTIPNKFLVDMGIDDPSTLDPAGISTAIGSGTAVVTPGADSTAVDVTGITFSPRSLRLKRGTITPTRVSALHAKRTGAHVRLRFHKAKARGSRIKHYEARCLAAHHPTRHATGKTASLLVKKLAGVHYSCEVRAVAVVGNGRWSKPRRTTA